MPVQEIDALRILDDTLGGLDETARERVLSWAIAKYRQGIVRPMGPAESGRQETAAPAALRRPSASPRAPSKSKARPAQPSIVRDLNLQPPGKQSFRDFAAAKTPDTNQQKGVVSVYYLRHTLAVDPVTSDHVFTCFKDTGWRVPADFQNSLQVTASAKGWLDTKSMKDIKLTTLGENLVEHDLPEKPPKR